MEKNDSGAADAGENDDQKQAEPRTPRSIRFSDSEWGRIEREAKMRGMAAAELVRHAAVNLASGDSSANPASFPPEIAAQIERIYRGVYLLSTLKRDEMLREGEQETLERIAKAARKSQTAIESDASRQVS